jgi:hypothetical protein
MERCKTLVSDLRVPVYTPIIVVLYVARFKMAVLAAAVIGVFMI